MDGATPSGSVVGADAPAGERYLLLADISGYTGFMAGVEVAHGIDFSGGIPAGYSVLGDLLDSVVKGVEPDFSLVKLEGDAVFAVAPVSRLDGRGERVRALLDGMYASFIERRTLAIPASDHICTACPSVAHLDLKVILHRGHSVRQAVGGTTELLGPAVTIAHRLLKNTIRSVIGSRPYLFVTDAAADALALHEPGIAHAEDYREAGQIQGRIIELGRAVPLEFE